MEFCLNFYFSIFILLLFSSQILSLHLVGTWNTSSFYFFLAKFGFQQTLKDEASRTQGYIYGNVTVSGDFNHDIALVVLDSEYFLNFFKNRNLQPSQACPKMFSDIAPISWDKDCNVNGTEDFIRYIPCKKNSLCRDETLSRLVPQSQFTFKVQDVVQPRYWYISMVACSMNKSCRWLYDPSPPSLLYYDIWFVNGNPSNKENNKFEHQFSVEQFDIFEIYLVFLLLYLFFIPIQFYAVFLKWNSIAVFLLFCVFLEFLGIVFCFSHFEIFSRNGIGVEKILHFGRFLDLLAQSCFMLLLLLVVKGMGVTCSRLPATTLILVLIIWLGYTIANISLFIWNLRAVQFLSDVDEWQTRPGFLILCFRICIMLWFLWELRKIFLTDCGLLRARFFLHFGAGFLTWFIYLPIVVFVCSQISAFWRYKTILSVCCSADFLSFCVMVHLLWPSRKYLYFNFNNLRNDSLLSYSDQRNKNDFLYEDEDDDY